MKLYLKRFTALPLFLCLFFSGYGEAQAFCSPRKPPQIDSATDYFLTLADTLVLLRTARDRSKDLKNTKSPMEFIAVLKTAGQEYNCAASYVAPYEKSKNEGLASSAEGLLGVSLTLGQINDYYLQEFKDRLDGKSEKPSTYGERHADQMRTAADAWQLEMTAVTLACLGLVEFDPVTQKQRLALTSQERSDLIKRLEKSFGHLSGEKAEGIPALENSVVLILDFLKDKERKSHDE